jgi:hypothetical protein
MESLRSSSQLEFFPETAVSRRRRCQKIADLGTGCYGRQSRYSVSRTTAKIGREGLFENQTCQYLLPLSCRPLWSGCGVSFTARCNVGWSSTSPSSDRSGAATRNASTSCFSLDTSSSFCLRTSYTLFMRKQPSSCVNLYRRIVALAGKGKPQPSSSSVAYGR